MTRLFTFVAPAMLGVTLGLPVSGHAQSPAANPHVRAALDEASALTDLASFPPEFVGRWRSAPFETPLDTDFDREVYGPRAVSVRTTDLTIGRSGEATLVVTRWIRNSVGPVPATRSIDTVTFKVMPATSEFTGNVSTARYIGSIGRADRTYPGQPVERTRIREPRVELVVGDDGGKSLELVFDTADARAAVNETLTRAPGVRASR